MCAPRGSRWRSSLAVSVHRLTAPGVAGSSLIALIAGPGQRTSAQATSNYRHQCVRKRVRSQFTQQSLSSRVLVPALFISCKQHNQHPKQQAHTAAHPAVQKGAGHVLNNVQPQRRRRAPHMYTRARLPQPQRASQRLAPARPPRSGSTRGRLGRVRCRPRPGRGSAARRSAHSARPLPRPRNGAPRMLRAVTPAC